MDINDLRLFAEALRTGGFAGSSAARLGEGLSGPRAIDALTRDLKERVARDLAPRRKPEDGEAFFRRVMPLIDAFDADRGRGDTPVAGVAKRLRITASPAFAQIRLPPILKAFRARRADVTVELILTDDVLDLVEHGIDLAVRHSAAADGAALDGSVVARRLAAVRHHVVASPDYLADAPRIAAPSDLADHACLTSAQGQARRRWRFRKAAREIDVAITPQLTTGDVAALRACALAGQGVALLPDWAVRQDIGRGALADAMPGWEAAGTAFEASLWLVFPSRRFISSHAIAFADVLSSL